METYKADQENIFFPNIRQSLHIGCDNYSELKNQVLKQTENCKNDANLLYEMFKNSLQFDTLPIMTEPVKIQRQTNHREKIIQFLDLMYNKHSGGLNPYTVNVITFSGHGISYQGDSIAIIPEIIDGQDQMRARFINMSGQARRFSQKEHTINIFILNMCRFQLTAAEDSKSNRNYNEEKKQYLPTVDNQPYEYLAHDTLSSQNQYKGFFPQKGYTIILHAVQEGTPAIDGKWIPEFIKQLQLSLDAKEYTSKFFQKYPKSLMQEFLNTTNIEQYERLEIFKPLSVHRAYLQQSTLKVNQNHNHQQNDGLFNNLRINNNSVNNAERFAEEIKQNHVQAPILNPINPAMLQLKNFQGTKCAADPEEIQYLEVLLGEKLQNSTMLYRGSLHGWTGRDLGSRAKGKKNLVHLLRLQNSNCIGGFTSLQAITEEKGFKDPEAFLFNLTKKRKFPVSQQHERAINFQRDGSWEFIGAFFPELSAHNPPFNRKYGWFSSWQGSSYDIGQDENGLNQLTMTNIDMFTITEIEVWTITDQ